MTERDIEGLVNAILGAMQAMPPPNTGAVAAVMLCKIALVDLHRIADALEAIASMNKGGPAS